MITNFLFCFTRFVNGDMTEWHALVVLFRFLAVPGAHKKLIGLGVEGYKLATKTIDGFGLISYVV